MSKFYRLPKRALLGSVLGAIISAPAVAQTTAPASRIEEIVVSAQKISENVNRVPLAVTSVGAKELADFHVTQLTDIGGYIPGLQVDSRGTPGQTNVAIRGIGGLNNDNATVSMYIDETPIGATSLHQRGGSYALDILPYDVQRIEVLAGPQGTLYGANAFGGVVKFVLTQPDLAHTDIRAGVDGFGISGGSDVGGGVRTMISTPLIQDKLAVLFSYAKLDTPGFIDNATTGKKDQNDFKQQSARFSVLGELTDDIEIRLNAIYSDMKSDGRAIIALDNSDHPKPLFSGYRDNNFVPNIDESHMHYYSLDLNWDLGWGNLVSATGYTRDRTLTVLDSTATYFGLADLVYNAVTTAIGAAPGLHLDPADTAVTFPLNLANEKFTQELRLSSKVGNLDWMVGGYYDDEEGDNLQKLPVKTLDGASVPIVDPLFNGSFPSTYKEYAAFGNIDYHFTEQFDVAVGLRYAHNKQTFRNIIAPVTFDIISPRDALGDSSESVTTYNFSPRYQITPDHMVYARVATGYQAGAPNIVIFGTAPDVDAARITTYEAGWKASFPAASAQFNIAVYDNEWKKIQVSATAPGGVGITLNAGDARSNGVTLDGSIRPLDGLTLSANFAYTNAKLIDDSAHAPGGPGGFDGDRLPQQPEVAGAVQVEYAWDLFADWRARLGGGVRMTGSRWMSGTVLIPETIGDTTLNPGDNRLNKYELDSYTAADLNADISNERYTIGMYVKNLTDEQALLTAVDVPDGLTNTPIQREGTVLRPRTIGISFDVKF